MHRINQLINKHIEDDKVKENIRSFIIQYACIENKVNEDRWFSVRKAIIGYSDFFIENFTWSHFCYTISLVGILSYILKYTTLNPSSYRLVKFFFNK